MKSPRLKLKLAKMPLYDEVELEKNEPLEEARTFVIRSKAVIFSGPARSCEEFRQKLQKLVDDMNEKAGGIHIQIYSVEHWADNEEYNEGVC